MGAKLLTGVPRSGTTLCCYLLNQYRNTVALHEPINPSDFSESREDAIKLIAEFAYSAHSQLLKNKSIVTKQRDGKIPNNPVGAGRESGRSTEERSTAVLHYTNQHHPEKNGQKSTRRNHKIH